MMTEIKITNYKKLKEAEAILEADVSYHRKAMMAEYKEARRKAYPFSVLMQGAKALMNVSRPDGDAGMAKVLIQPVAAFLAARLLQKVTGKTSWANLAASVTNQFFNYYKDSVSSVFSRAFRKKQQQEPPAE
jgi:hypothetical protein